MPEFKKSNKNGPLPNGWEVSDTSVGPLYIKYQWDRPKGESIITTPLVTSGTKINSTPVTSGTIGSKVKVTKNTPVIVSNNGGIKRNRITLPNTPTLKNERVQKRERVPTPQPISEPEVLGGSCGSLPPNAQEACRKSRAKKTGGKQYNKHMNKKTYKKRKANRKTRRR